MLVIGLTGGIASGKTTVANLFAQFNVPIIDTDIIARQVVEPGNDTLEKIRSHFGSEIIQDDGTLNRKKLADIIFNNQDEKKWLEALLHPLIRQQVKQQLATLGHNTAYCIIVVPLLAESPVFTKMVDRILVINTSLEQQKQFLIQRNHIEEEAALTMIKSQATPQQRLEIADDIIDNQGAIQQLEQQVSILHEKYLAIAKKNT